MVFIIICVSMIAVGAVVGRFVVIPFEARGRKILPVVQKIQFIAIIFIVFIMGLKIGADVRVWESIGTIGLASLVITVLTVAGSVLCVFALRRALKFDRKGERRK